MCFVYGVCVGGFVDFWVVVVIVLVVGFWGDCVRFGSVVMNVVL